MAGQAGQPGTGGGGGGGAGGGNGGGIGGDGGCGVVVVQYRAPFAFFNGGTITVTQATDGSGTVITHTFSSPGTFYLSPLV